MPLLYRYIKGRSDFYPLLEQTLADTRELASRYPPGQNAPLESILAQLEAMTRWTYTGRDPTPTERKSITAGTVVARELSPAHDAASSIYNLKVTELSDYFKRWLTDEELVTFDAKDWRSYVPD